MSESCPECGSRNIGFQTNGICHCRTCGLVLEDLPPETNKTLPIGRTASNPAMSKAGSYMPDGAIVKASWMLSSKEKNLIKANRKINQIIARLSLPKYIKEQAYLLYKQAIYQDLSVGRDNLSLIFACVYATCNLNSLPKTPKEILEDTGKYQKGMFQAYNLLKENFKLEILPSDPLDFIDRYASYLKISQNTLLKSKELLEKLKSTNIFTGRHPESIVAAAIYLACKLNKEEKSQREISAVCGIRERTIRKRYKEIEEKLSEIS